MCRVAAYLGPPAPLSALLYDPPHSLDHQSYAPRQMLRGHVNVDGTGVAWWSDDALDDPPLRYVTERPPWSDANLPTLGPRITGTMQLTAVRSATPGVPFGPGNVAPFVRGSVAGVHNGWLGRFRERTGRELTARLPDHLYGALDAVSDSLVVFLTVAKHLEAQPDAGLASALRSAVSEIVEVCADADAEATLNVVVGDGHRLVAVRASHAMEGNNPLHVLQGGKRFPGATVLASEPLDDDGDWEPLDDDRLVEITREGVTTSPIDIGSAA